MTGPLMDGKVVIYQVLPRLLGNASLARKPGGTIGENGCGKMGFFTDAVLRRIKAMGVTHVWYTGLLRHATRTDYSAHGIPRQHPAVVKGNAGSPYAVADYYDVDPDLATDVDGRMGEFEALVGRTHAAGLGVVMDFVPNHVAREYRSVCRPQGVEDLGQGDDTGMAFSPRNNFYYCWGQPFEPSIDLLSGAAEPYAERPARATGNDRFDARPGPDDWYETVKLNYGVDYCDAAGRSTHFDPVPDTWGKMADILLFWAGKGVDGFRCDMAEMVPVEFWRWAVDRVRRRHGNVRFIGEVYNPGLYRSYVDAGFDWLYDKVGMYDCLCGVARGERPASHITRQWQAVDDIRDRMLYFMENHDEPRLASDFLAGDARRGVPATLVSLLMGTNPFMLYAGQEVGERGMDAEGFSGLDGRTTIFDYWTVAGLHHEWVDRGGLGAGERALEGTYARMLAIARNEAAVSRGAFFDLMYANTDPRTFDSGRLYAFIRKWGNEVLLVVANFSPLEARCGLTVPGHAFSHLGMEEGDVTATDLLTGERAGMALKAGMAIPMSVPANGARVWKAVL